MTKKHFIALANKLVWLRGFILSSDDLPQVRQGRLDQWLRTQNALADFCAEQNPNFDRSRWLAYIAGECGPNGGAR